MLNPAELAAILDLLGLRPEPEPEPDTLDEVILVMRITPATPCLTCVLRRACLFHL